MRHEITTSEAPPAPPEKTRLDRLEDFVRRWAYFGTERYPPRTARRLSVINILSAMVSIMTLPYIFLYLAWDAKGLLIPIITLSPQILLFAVTPFWHRAGPQAAATHLSVVWIVFALLYTWYFGRGSGLHYYFLPGVAASMLVFGAQNMRLSGAVTLLALSCFVLTERGFTGPADFIPADPALVDLLFYITVPMSFFLVFATVYFAFYEASRAEDALEREHERSEALLANMLPDAVARRLKAQPHAVVADDLSGVSVLFADIVDFTPRASRLSASQTVIFLNRVFSAFDELAERHGLEKIKTVGDAYMAAGGLRGGAENHLTMMAEMALAMQASVAELGRRIGETIDLRIGINAGPAVAGVIGTRKFAYDVWGDTVNLAARMESHSLPGRIQVTEAVRDALQADFTLTERGVIDVKGVGPMRTWFLDGRRTPSE